MWTFRVNRRQWDIVIANRAGLGPLPQSLPSPFGSPTLCGLLGVRNMLPRSKRPNSVNCKKCGGLMNNHPTIGLVDVYAATLPTLRFSTSVHINYAETVLPMRDGLPKLKDFPKEFGGSGEVVPE